MILTKEQRKVLDYIATANRGGHRPTAELVEEWRAAPAPKKGERGPLISPGKAPVYTRALQDALRSGPGMASEALTTAAQALSLSIESALSTSFGNGLSVVPDFEGTPPVYGPPGPAETFVAHLQRLGWVSVSLGGLEVTPFGRALLRADASPADLDELYAVVPLPAGDELAYPLLMGHIADSGPALIVDPYLKATQLSDLLSDTDAARFLVGPRLSKSDITSMRVLIRSNPGRRVEMRQAGENELHDRVIVGTKGVHTVGTSLNGVGKSSTTHLVQLPETAADAYSTQLEALWATATVLIANPSPPD